MSKEALREPVLEDALVLAARAHKGQTDLAGREFILHPLRMMATFPGRNEHELRLVALLHDVIEDTDVTPEILMADGYPKTVIEAVVILTRTPLEDYDAYLNRVRKNFLATRVKIADLNDHLDFTRDSAKFLPAETLRRYQSARTFLISVLPNLAPSTLIK